MRKSLAIAIAFRDFARQRPQNFHFGGEDRPSPLLVGSPGQRLSTGMRVRALCGCISCICMYVNCNNVGPSCLVPVWVFFFWKSERAGEALGHFVSEVLCLFLLLVVLA